jgi:hypothetical protein
MEELSQQDKDLLREFADTPYFKAYVNYILLNTGKCLGNLRTTFKDPDRDIYIKGEMRGLEKLFLDIISDMVDSGNVIKANTLNMDYTEKLLKRTMGAE